MIQDFLMRKMLASKLKGVPQEEIDKIMALVKNNPDFFQKFAEEVQQKMTSGKDQMEAVKEVMKAHEEELKNITK